MWCKTTWKPTTIAPHQLVINVQIWRSAGHQSRRCTFQASATRQATSETKQITVRVTNSTQTGEKRKKQMQSTSQISRVHSADFTVCRPKISVELQLSFGMVDQSCPVVSCDLTNLLHYRLAVRSQRQSITHSWKPNHSLVLTVWRLPVPYSTNCVNS